MTDPMSEPGNADLLVFMQQAFAHLTAEISGLKTDLRAGLEGLREEVHGDIRASEARLASRVGDVQQVVQSLKADLAAHAGDPDAHHRHAA